ncbi:homoserine dehydrogenase [Desulfosporosinus sp. BICA1-9]|uniref:homoserine dehydrogenase n=1 Tax=Desulfosporosinus sp. BICA1-9 TaxID=1531958 RepID=UPI00054BB8F7|nr:homoserine dehydrogenase [Desulfosporosinus sp. BICA1-9]KJS50064.1 MAG: homoserine dehydrogenase [Peptococcaceae bacterium BRH_c23]KJS89093.1 MAG: homoserine dehydrogenase [Desulfosporosinus sp. BICA1-9]
MLRNDKEDVRVGLLGFGIVGQGLVQGINLQINNICRRLGAPLKIQRALVQDPKKKRVVGLPEFTTNARDILEDPEIDIVVEVMGGEQPAYAYIKQALEQRKQVVTANKLLLALHGPELKALARRNGTGLLYEGSVLGGIPILRTIQRGLCGDRVEEVQGIFNGTTNFILTRMHDLGEDYSTALRLAQKAGYAEADPSMDVSGLDAACKLVILCRECFDLDIQLKDVTMAGIEQLDKVQIALEKGQGRIPKLIARAKPQKQEIRVGVEWLPDTDLLSRVSGVQNALSLRTLLAGELFWSGPGAGGLATGGAVLADIMEAAERVLVERDKGFLQAGR